MQLCNFHCRPGLQKLQLSPQGCHPDYPEPLLIILPLKCLSSAKLPSPPSRLAWRCPRPADGACPIAPRTFPAGPESASGTAAQTTTWYSVRDSHLSKDMSGIDLGTPYPHHVLPCSV
jgi:hypothetical protein